MGRVACWSLVSKKLRESFKGAERDFKGLGRLVMGALLGRTCQASKMAEALGVSKESFHKSLQRLHERYLNGEFEFDAFGCGREAAVMYYRNRKYLLVCVDPTEIPMKGVGRVKPKRPGEYPQQGLLKVTCAVPVKDSRCLIVDVNIISSDLINGTGTSRNILYLALVERVSEALGVSRSEIRIIFVMDREFGCENILRELLENKELFVVRLKRNVGVVLGDGRRVVLKKLVEELPPGTHRFPGCRYKGKYPINLVIHKRSPTWASGKGENGKEDDDCLIIATNLSSLDLALSFYRKRMQIDETFRDEKSGIFNLDKSQYRRLDRFEFIAKVVAFAHNLSIIAALRLLRSKASLLAAKLVRDFEKQILSLTGIGWRYLCQVLRYEIPNFLTPHMLRQRKALGL